MRRFALLGDDRVIYGESIEDALRYSGLVLSQTKLNNRDKFFIEHNGYMLYTSTTKGFFGRDKKVLLVYKDVTPSQ